MTGVQTCALPISGEVEEPGIDARQAVHRAGVEDEQVFAQLVFAQLPQGSGAGFQLLPVGFFDSNPAPDVPPSETHDDACEHG